MIARRSRNVIVRLAQSSVKAVKLKCLSRCDEMRVGSVSQMIPNVASMPGVYMSERVYMVLLTSPSPEIRRSPALNMGLLEQFPPVSFKTCVLIVLASIGLHLLRNKYRPHLRRIPGPAIAGYTDLWRFINCLTSTPHQTHIDLHRKYASKFIRIGPRTISISDTTLIPKIYGLNSGFTKTAFYSLSMPPYKGQFTPSLFTTRDEEYHAKHRRPIASAYSMSTLVEVEPLIDSTTSLFMRRLDEFAAEGQMFDLGLWLQMFAFDVIGEVVFSKKLGFLETRSDVDGICPESKLERNSLIAILI